ncbi:MAG: hypothetical protein KatS3mg126_0173 [Lysobacteraceae bacterium]|nr:MAG: hypothetical protein KatS3mg126_0173 [Xanthomonadaceae bacterium]
MPVPGDAVEGVEAAEGQAEESTLTEPAAADAAGPGAGRGVRQDAAQGRVGLLALLGEQRRALGEAGNPDVVGLAVQAIGGELEAVVSALHLEHGRALIGGAVTAQLGPSRERGILLAAGHFGNAPVDDVDRTADRAAAVEQGRRSLEDLDLLGQEGLDADRVVGADRGGVQ